MFEVKPEDRQGLFAFLRLCIKCGNFLHLEDWLRMKGYALVPIEKVKKP